VAGARFSPYAAGSGIPEVETALQGELPPMPLARLLLVKFVGGLLALGGGMALGPEGPSVQMGAVGARLIGSRFRRRWPDTRSLVAAGTGAGLAVAFNAPIAGAVFVLEELHRHFNRREALAALGVVAGLAGAVYNRTLIGALNLAERVDRWGVHPQAAAVGVLVGGIGWFAPHLIGGGETLTQGILVGAVAVGVVPFVFVLRFFFGAACYAVRAPGGLFAPLLLLGAQLGMLCGAVSRSAFPGLGIDPQAFAVIGMAAFFTGVVRAPITGIVLVIEMTAAFALLLPMLAASFAAMVAAALIGIPPIYRSLSERLRDRARVD
jgi:CIC family chloride channel protein